MPIFDRGSPIIRIVDAGSDIVEVRQGSALIWSASTIFVDFGQMPNRGNLAPEWEHLAGDFPLGVVDGKARSTLPDGQVAWSHFTSQARYVEEQMPNADYFLEFQIGSQGAGDSWLFNTKHRTQVLVRCNNTGSVTNAVGVDLYASTLRIVRRSGSTSNQTMVSCGAYAPGDIVQLRGVGNEHFLYCNGEYRESWDDEAGSVQSGPSYRSLVINNDASKDLLGPRRFGPTINYVQLY
ncbi:hypothetical protein SEA_GODPHATHER_34 [Mycobacterium phage GodPhather]|uniref:Minor tail protein n=1 Tax=Mycobacterium phage Jeon TaxID=2108123 RepID=A0A2P1JRF5_9CAUD|nr:minor tail protein [Mycobacterium phage Jeon]AVO21736.1 hypothetical protein SEA_JEON_33 [Mycobacterium phage Jeon]QBP32607.1 hypothetical protein SEA_GODPHATHER_34 [Mycobacterium phage GodPhather]